MKSCIIYALCAFLGVLIQMNAQSAFGFQAMIHFPIIAAVMMSLASLPLMYAAIVMLMLAFSLDAFASGPVGLYAICFMFTFGAAYALAAQIRTARAFIAMILCVFVAAAFEAMLAAAYAAYYRDSIFLKLFAQNAWINALLTALFAPPFMALCHLLQNLFTRKKRTMI